MTAYINKLKDKTGNQQLPVTHERAVRDDNGTTLETKLQNLEGAMDKAYVASSDNGMGRITLKKNMVSGVNTLTQSMMQATNTIYVIRYDFTLGENITVPANCVLDFEGGSISNGVITGQNTEIVGDYRASNVFKKGTFIDHTNYFLNAVSKHGFTTGNGNSEGKTTFNIKLNIDYIGNNTIGLKCFNNSYNVINDDQKAFGFVNTIIQFWGSEVVDVDFDITPTANHTFRLRCWNWKYFDSIGVQVPLVYKSLTDEFTPSEYTNLEVGYRYIIQVRGCVASYIKLTV